MESEKNLEQLFAEREAAYQEWMQDWAEFRRLAVKLGIPLSALKLPTSAGPTILVANSPMAREHNAVPACPVPLPPSKVEIPPAAPSPTLPWASLTIGSLIAQYREHPQSSYQKLKFNVRKNYDSHLDKLTSEIGSMTLRQFDADKLFELYAKWIEGGKISTGHGLLGKLRLLCTFGITVLKDEDAVRLSTILNKIKVPTSEGKRMKRLTAEHARLIRAKAHDMRWHSIALVQAFQFDFADKLRQIDIIGEWVPMDEPGESSILRTDTHDRQEKWLRGITWAEIDDRLILRHHITSGRATEAHRVMVDLKQGAMVMEEINRLSPMDKTGPVAICEFTGKPWTAVQFRQRWRQVANLAGVPKDVRNMDTGRPAEDDGEPDEDVFE